MKTQLDGFLQVGSRLYGCPVEVLRFHITALIEELERGEIDSYALWEELGESLAINGLGRPREPEQIEMLWHQTIEDSLVLIPEMLALCRQLEGRIPMAVLSNTIHDHAQNLRSRGVYEIFNPCVLSCEVGMRKPESRIYFAVCDLLNTPPENCLLIDDLQINIQAAKSCRMQVHHFVNIESLRKRLTHLELLHIDETGESGP